MFLVWWVVACGPGVDVENTIAGGKLRGRDGHRPDCFVFAGLSIVAKLKDPPPAFTIFRSVVAHSLPFP